MAVSKCRTCNKDIQHEEDGIRFWDESGRPEDYCGNCIAMYVSEMSTFTNAELKLFGQQPFMAPQTVTFIH